MFPELMIAVLLGICFGIFTGLIPGIHINLVALLLFQFAPLLLLKVSVLALACFIIAMAVTHTFLDFLPSIFFGAPEADTSLGVLPGHKMLLEGKAFDAIKLTVIGSLGALLLAVLFIPIMFLLVGKLYPFLKVHIGMILAMIVCYMLMKDGKRKWNVFVFFLSGIFGLIVLNMPGLKDPLLPMLSGLFGISTLLLSLQQQARIPPQCKRETVVVPKKTSLQAIVASTITGMFTAFFPGMGSAQGAVLASQFVSKLGNHGFLILVGGINTVNFVLSLVTLIALEKARNGAVLTIAKLMVPVPIQVLPVFVGSALCAGGVATFLALFFGRVFGRVVERLNYQRMVYCILFLVTAVVVLFSGFLGLLVLVIATAIGLIPALKNTPRNHAMGCLLLPVIVWLL